MIAKRKHYLVYNNTHCTNRIATLSLFHLEHCFIFSVGSVSGHLTVIVSKRFSDELYLVNFL